MKSFLRSLMAMLWLLAGTLLANAGNYTVAKGKEIQVRCTASAPAGGYITHAFFSFVNPEDAAYLGIYSVSSDCSATFYGLQPKSRIQIEVTYAYSYRGSYDNNMHVGHGSYYDYITVEGAPNATGVRIREGNSLKMRTGQTVTVHADFTPSNAEGVCNWGFLNALGQPWKFNLEVVDNGAEARITAKTAGSVYVIAMLPDNEKSAQVLSVEASDNAEVAVPESMTLEPGTVTLTKGESVKLWPSFTPEKSYAEVTWSTSRKSVAMVDESGEVKAVAAGEAVITATTAAGLKASATIVVQAAVEDFSLPSRLTMNLGYSYQLEPKFAPSGASATLKWSSSDSSVASVSASGVITARQAGNVTVTASMSDPELSHSVEVTIVKPDADMEHRNAKVRLQAIKALVNKTVINP